MKKVMRQSIWDVLDIYVGWDYLLEENDMPASYYFSLEHSTDHVTASYPQQADIYGSDELDSVDDIHYIIVSQMKEREKESQNENT